MGTVEKVVQKPVIVDVAALDGITDDVKLGSAVVTRAEQIQKALAEKDKPLMVEAVKAMMTLLTAALVRAEVNPVLIQREEHVAETQASVANR